MNNVQKEYRRFLSLRKSELHRLLVCISYPVSPGRSRSITQLVDLFPTICDLTGVPVPEDLDGRSLRPVLEDPAVKIHDGAVSFVNGGIGLRTERWAWMSYRDGTSELYDMDRDPGQYTNLADRADQVERVRAFSSLLRQLTAEIPQAKQNSRKRTLDNQK